MSSEMPQTASSPPPWFALQVVRIGKADVGVEKDIAACLNALADMEPVTSERGKGTLEALLWSGRPFLLVGKKDALVQAFAPVREDALLRRCLADHAYWWVRTDEKGAVSLADLLGKAPVTPREVVKDVEPWGSPAFTSSIRSQLELLHKTPNLLGLSNGMHDVRCDLVRIADGVAKPGPDSPVLIIGPSGSGKEEVARALHRLTSPSESPVGGAVDGMEGLAAVACGQMSPELLMSEVFGHRKGAFTGATKDRDGLLADGSRNTSVFFDDFDNAPRTLGGALLRVLQTGRYRVVGDDKDTATSKWLLFSTNKSVRNLRDSERGPVPEGFWPGFPRDFIFRFEDRVIALPDLRERLMDLPVLARQCWARLVEKRNCQAAKDRLYDAAFRDLVKAVYDGSTTLDGNVRALATLLARVFSDGCEQRNREQRTSVLLSRYLERRDGDPTREFWDWVGITPHDRRVMLPPARSPIQTDPDPSVAHKDTAEDMSELVGRKRRAGWADKEDEVLAFYRELDAVYSKDKFLDATCKWLCRDRPGLSSDVLQAWFATQPAVLGQDVAWLLLHQSLRPQNESNPMINIIARWVMSGDRAGKTMAALREAASSSPLNALIHICKPRRGGKSVAFILST